jgi:D-glycero-alpha-D-manno-heptose 1-phosphate guanylyltransferase
MKINKTLVVLAGGFGTRLQSVLKGLPKPMADINGIPFLQFQFENWIEKGFDDFVISLHYEAQIIIDFIEKKKDNLLKNCKIQCIVEPVPLGTGGAIKYIISKADLSNNFFITNADTWISNGYSDLLLYSECAIGLTNVENTYRYGQVIIDEQKNIISFIEKNINNKKGFINIGIYKLNKSIFLNFKNDMFSLEVDLFPQLSKAKELKGVLILSDFIDIGIPEDYNRFCNLKSR